MRALLVIAVAACGGAPPVARAPSPASGAAVAALQASRFDEARTQATAALAADPHDARAAAVRAIATYQAAGSTLIGELGAVLESGEHFKYFDHERGRAAWRAFADALDAVDRDLAVVAADPSFSLELCLACWEHDWNRNGTVDDRDRALFEIEDDGKGGELPPGDPRRRPTFRFDVGDADWARAMISFQRAGTDIVLAYRWSELDKLEIFHPTAITLHLIDPGRIRHARERIIAGLRFAQRCRTEYLAETDDDREWVPSPRQKSHPIPFAVDDDLYATWAAILGDAEHLLTSTEGISLQELAALVEPSAASELPAAYIDVGKLLGEPSDIVIDFAAAKGPDGAEHVLRGLLGHGYALKMRASPLVGRLRHMKQQLERGEDTLGHKLRYLLWLN